MWVLVQEPTGGGVIEGLESGPASWGLVPGSTYSVGRSVSSTIQSPGDTSISKQHARFVVSPALRAGERPEVLLEDLGSKYGTHMNSSILSESQRLAADSAGKVSRALSKPVRLKDNDRIRFGVMFSIYRLKWLVLQVTSSMLKSKAALETSLGRIEAGTTVQNLWTETTTHLVMNNISLSLKVVNSLAKGVPIVTPEFFRDFFSSLQSQQKLPLSSNYIPSVSSTDTESQLRDPGINFQVNLQRRKVFKDKTFVFFAEKQMKEIQTPIKLSGGSCLLWSEAGQSLTSLIKPGYCVVQPAGLAKSSSQQTLPPSWSTVSDTLTSAGLTSVLSTSIYLAVVHCSTSVHCNPRHRGASLLPPRPASRERPSPAVVVEDTEQARDTESLATFDTQPVVDSTSETQGPPASSVMKQTPEDRKRGLSDPDEGDQTRPSKQMRGQGSEEGNISRADQQMRGQGSDERDQSRLSKQMRGQSSEESHTSRANQQMRRNSSGENLTGDRSQTVNTELEGLGGKSISRTNGTVNVAAEENNPSQHITGESRKRRISTENSGSASPPRTGRRRVRSPSPAAEEDDIFGFGDSPKKSRNNVSNLPGPKSTELGCNGEKERADAEVFGFDDSEDEETDNVISSTNKGKTSAVGKVRPGVLPTVSNGGKNNAATPTDTTQHSTASSKDIFSLTAQQSESTRTNTTGFVGKGDLTIKSEVKDPKDEEDELSRTLCRVTSLSMLRPNTTRPQFVPAPDPVLLGRPTANFKKFRKQPVVLAQKTLLAPYLGPGEMSHTRGVAEWLEEHQEVAREEREQESRQRQMESEDFWSFHNSQDLGGRGGNRRKGRV